MPTNNKPPQTVLMISTDHLMIDRRILQQARSLVEAGYEVTVASGFECPQASSYEENGIKIHRFTYDWSYNAPSRLTGLWQKAMKAFNLILRPHNVRLGHTGYTQWIRGVLLPYKADIIHVHDLPLLWLGYELSKQWKSHLIYDAHEIYYAQSSLPKRARRILCAQEKHLVPKLNFFSTVNEFCAKHFEQVHGVKPVVFYNSVPQAIISADREDSRRALRKLADIPFEHKVVLYQGWISPERNLRSLVCSCEFIPDDTHIVVIGYGDYRQQLEQELQGKTWENRVHFLGKIEPSKLITLTAGADLGIIPYQPIDLNHQFCSPNKFFEFVQSGVPVLSEELPFFQMMREKFGCVHTGKLNTAASLGQEIKSLLSNAEYLSSLQRNCINAAAQLCWEVEGARLIELYKQTCQSK